MFVKKDEYKNHIWKNGWVSGDKRWHFHAHGVGVELDGKVHMEDGNLYDWNISDDKLIMGDTSYTIIAMKTNANSSLILKNESGDIETFINL